MGLGSSSGDLKKKRRVLITGGYGYLGARLGTFLARDGYCVTLGCRDASANVVLPGCKRVITDWDDPHLNFCKGYDIVLHAAGMNASDCLKEPSAAIRFNGELTKELAIKSAESGCGHFIYLSTVHVYQNPLTGNFTEQSSPTNTHPYATSHIHGEGAVLGVANQFEITGQVLRISNCFGYPASPSQTCWDLVLNQFIYQAVIEGRIEIKGNRFQRRDFLPVGEFAHVVSALLAQGINHTGVINVCTGVSRTLLEAAEIVAEIVGGLLNKPIQILMSKIHDAEGNLHITSTALADFGIKPSADLTNEIKHTAGYIKSRE